MAEFPTGIAPVIDTPPIDIRTHVPMRLGGRVFALTSDEPEMMESVLNVWARIATFHPDDRTRQIA